MTTKTRPGRRPKTWEERAFLDTFPLTRFTPIAEYNGSRGGYDGYGAAVAQDPEGKYWVAEYSHCSCYGPEDSMNGPYGPEETYELALRRLGYVKSDLPKVEPR